MSVLGGFILGWIVRSIFTVDQEDPCKHEWFEDKEYRDKDCMAIVETAYTCKACGKHKYNFY